MTGRPVALVTGGAKRIGAAVVRRLAEAGYDVAIHCGRSRDEAAALAADLARVGARSAVLPADLADWTEVAGIIPAAVAALGPVSLLVNSASRFDDDAVGQLEAKIWDAHFAINLRAPVLLAEAFAKQAPDTGEPSVVNLLDQRVLRPNPSFFSYSLTKSALHVATITMAQALAPRIRVNGVAPGPTLANIHDGDGGLEREIAGAPLRHGVDPEEIAEAVLYLARARSVTGQTIAVDSGQHLGWRTPDFG